MQESVSSNKEKYNVVLLAPLPPPPGGIGTWTKNYLSIAREYNINLKIVDEKISNRKVFGKGSKKNYLVEIKRCNRIWHNLRKVLKEDKNISVVHSCIPALTTSILRELFCLFIAHKHKRKFIIHFRSTTPISIKGRFGKFIYRQVLKKSDAVITINRQSYDHVLKNAKNKEKVFLIPNFAKSQYLDTKKIYREKVQSVFYCAGVTEEKGAKILLDVAKRLPDISFRFAGVVDNDISDYCKALALKNVVFLGAVDHQTVESELLNDDIFVFPTFYPNEAFSNSLLEAMSFGIPAIATDWAANKDMLSETNGLIVPTNDSEAIFTAIKKLSSKNVREQIGKASKNKVKQNYTEQVVIQKYKSVYDFVAR